LGDRKGTWRVKVYTQSFYFGTSGGRNQGTMKHPDSLCAVHSREKIAVYAVNNVWCEHVFTSAGIILTDNMAYLTLDDDELMIGLKKYLQRFNFLSYVVILLSHFEVCCLS